MGEVGCLKDGHFQNLQVEGSTIFNRSSTIQDSDLFTGVSGVGPTDIVIGKGSSGGAADIMTSGDTQLYTLGTKLFYGNRVFRYGRMAAGAVTAGKCVTHSAPALDAEGGAHFDLGLTANVDAGETDISIETTGTNLTPNQYADGYLWVNDGTGEGQLLRIKSNPAHVHASDPSVVITCYDALKTAIALSDTKICVIADPYSALIVQAATTTGATLGITCCDMAALDYGWFCISGPCAVLTSGTVVVGNHAVPLGASGAVGPAAGDVIQVIGTVMIVNVTADYSLINLYGIA